MAGRGRCGSPPRGLAGHTRGGRGIGFTYWFSFRDWLSDFHILIEITKSEFVVAASSLLLLRGEVSAGGHSLNRLL